MTEQIFSERQMIRQIKSYPTLILYGAGMVGELVLSRLNAHELKNQVVGIGVTKKGKSTQEKDRLCGVPIFEISELKEYRKNSLVMVATLPNIQKEIKSVLDQLGFENQIFMTIKLYMELGRFYMADFNQHHPINFPKSSKAKIVIMASDNNKVSGAFLCLAELCSQLQKRGIGVLAVLPHHGSGASLLIEKGIPHTYILSKDWGYPIAEDHNLWSKIRFGIYLLSNYKAKKKLIHLFRENKVDLVHCNTTFTYIGAAAAKKCQIPFVWHLRENMENLGYRIFCFPKAFGLMQKSSQVIAVSDYIKGLMPFQEEQVCTIYDGVKWEEKAGFQRKRFHQKMVNMILVGTLEPHKGQKEAIVACGILKNKNCLDFQLILVGRLEESYIREITEMIHQLGLEYQVFLYGRRDDVFDLYNQSDISLVCGGKEAYGRVTIESQLSGCLVIGVNSGGTCELIQDGKTGYLYQAGSGEDLAEKITKAVSEPEKSERIAAWGQEYAKENYTSEKGIEQVIKVYEKAIKRTLFM